MSLLADKVRTGAYIQQQNIIAAVQALLQIRNGQHGFLAQPADQARQKSHYREQRQRQQRFLDQPFTTTHRFAPGIAKIGVGKGAWQHTDIGRQQVMTETYPGQSQCIVEQVKGEQRHQANKRHKAPALCFHATDEPFEAAAGFISHPVRRQVAGYQKGQRCTYSRAGQVIKGAEHRAKQGTTRQGQYGPRQKQYRTDCIDQHEQQRRQHAGILNPVLHRGGIKLIPVTDSNRDCRQQNQEYDYSNPLSFHRHHSIPVG